MQMPAYKSFSEFPETAKGWEAWVQQCKEWEAYREWHRKRRFHALPEDKGIPVEGTGKISYRKHKNGSGVSANSRILPHRYADEGEKGKLIRKQVRHRERALWLSDWMDEGYDHEDGFSVSDWFGSAELVWDWDYEETDNPCGDAWCKICDPLN